VSDYCAEVEDRLVEMLASAGTLNQVRTIETSVRECLFSGDKLTQGFRADELPAIAVSAQLKPARKAPWTSGEREIDIPLSIVVITKARTRRDALRQAGELRDAVDVVLDQARRSGNPLGDNTVLMGEVVTSATTIEEKPHVFAISTTECQIFKVVSL
jgi:hypothetical protein